MSRKPRSPAPGDQRAPWFRSLGQLQIPRIATLLRQAAPPEEEPPQSPEIQPQSRRFCARCGRQRQAGEYSCPQCQGVLYTARPQALEHATATSPPILGMLTKILEIPAGWTVLLHGPRGSGKTTIALQTFPAFQLVSSEMAPDAIGRYCARLGIQSPLILDGVCKLGPDQRYFFDPSILDRSDVVFDSLTSSCPDPTIPLMRVCSWASDTGNRAIFIAHNTKDDDARGATTLQHKVDIVVQIDRSDDHYRLSTTKNRGGPERSTIYVKDPIAGLIPPRLDWYYTIEGNGPRYSLLPWPKQGPWSEPLRLAELGKVKLPPPPLAVCAQRSKLADSGWILPGDLEERKLFADSINLPFWDPDVNP